MPDLQQKYFIARSIDGKIAKPNQGKKTPSPDMRTRVRGYTVHEKSCVMHDCTKVCKFWTRLRALRNELQQNTVYCTVEKDTPQLETQPKAFYCQSNKKPHQQYLSRLPQHRCFHACCFSQFEEYKPCILYRTRTFCFVYAKANCARNFLENDVHLFFVSVFSRQIFELLYVFAVFVFVLFVYESIHACPCMLQQCHIMSNILKVNVELDL